MAGVTAPPTTPKTTTSVDPLYQEAIAHAKAALAAEQAPIQAEQAQTASEYKQREADATGASSAVAGLLKNIGPAVAGTYRSAAQNQTLLADGFSQGMQDALKGNTDNLNAMLAKLGSPAQLDSHATEAGDVLYGKGGYIPATTFNREGAAFGAAADMLPGTALLRGQEQVKSLKAQAITADQGFQNKLAEMASKLPGDVQTNYEHLQTLALQNAKFREQVHKDNFDAAYKQAELKLATAKYATSIDEFNTRTTLDYKKLALQSQRVAQDQYNADRNYAVKLADLGIAQKNLQLKILQQSVLAANGGLSKKDVTKYTSVAQSVAMQGYNGYTTYTTKNGAKTPQNVGRVSYFEALQQGLKKGVPVQIMLDALDRVYPTDLRPTAAALAQQLGPLDPNALAQLAQQAKTAAGNAETLNIDLSPTAALKAGAVLKIAKSMLGTPYVWGGTSPGKALDCSGFVQQVFKQVGINLPRTTYEQVRVGRPVQPNQLQPGDLVFTEPTSQGPGHVGIYVGQGMIQESPHTGDINKYIPLRSFLSGGFVAARRVLG